MPVTIHVLHMVLLAVCLSVCLCVCVCVCVCACLLMPACMSAGEEPSSSGGLGDPITRLVLRLVLLYVQQAPVPRARDCVQQALFLLPHLLNAHDILSR